MYAMTPRSNRMTIVLLFLIIIFILLINSIYHSYVNDRKQLNPEREKELVALISSFNNGGIECPTFSSREVAAGDSVGIVYERVSSSNGWALKDNVVDNNKQVVDITACSLLSKPAGVDDRVVCPLSEEETVLITIPSKDSVDYDNKWTLVNGMYMKDDIKINSLFCTSIYQSSEK